MKKHYLLGIILLLLGYISISSFIKKSEATDKDKLIARLEKVIRASKGEIKNPDLIVNQVENALSPSTYTPTYASYMPTDTTIKRMTNAYQSWVVGTSVTGFVCKPTPNYNYWHIPSTNTQLYQLNLGQLNYLVMLAQQSFNKCVFFRFGAMEYNSSTYQIDYCNQWNNNPKQGGDPTHRKVVTTDLQKLYTLIPFTLDSLSPNNFTVDHYYNLGTICPPPGGICGKITNF